MEKEQLKISEGKTNVARAMENFILELVNSSDPKRLEEAERKYRNAVSENGRDYLHR